MVIRPPTHPGLGSGPNAGQHFIDRPHAPPPPINRPSFTIADALGADASGCGPSVAQVVGAMPLYEVYDVLDAMKRLVDEDGGMRAKKGNWHFLC